MLDDKDWRNLLREIHQRQVIPIIGPALVTVTDPATGSPIAVSRYLAPKLASALCVDEPQKFTTLNEAVRAHLLGGGERNAVYQELRTLYDELKPAPSSALASLASITDFDLFVSCTPDPCLSWALQQQRPGFRADRNTLSFHPSKPLDLPDPLPPSFLYHILGDYNTYPDFAVWEEDFMEYICGLLESRDILKNMFRTLKSRYLLLLGAPSEDWVVRFFLRVARQQRLSERRQRDYLADSHENLGAPMIFFFDRIIGATRIVQGDSTNFVEEMTRRWRERYATATTGEDFLQQMPDEMPKGAVFISYSRDDLTAACAVDQDLALAGVPVWLDKQRLRVGENFERSLEHTIKDGCSFFISIISAATESDATRYVHKERQWAANRHVDGFVFYLPIIIDDTPLPQLEPKCFKKVHHEHMVGGRIGSEFSRRVFQLVEEYRQSGRPRG